MKSAEQRFADELEQFASSTADMRTAVDAMKGIHLTANDIRALKIARAVLGKVLQLLEHADDEIVLNSPIIVEDEKRN